MENRNGRKCCHIFDKPFFRYNPNKIFERLNKLVPFITINFKTQPLSNAHYWLDLRTFFIQEKLFDDYGFIYGGDSLRFYPKNISKNFRYINQVSFNGENSRVLYPYNYQLQLQQGAGFYRINATANYFFNYSKGGGLAARFFASKFGSFGRKDDYVNQYQPKLLAGNGGNDFTYSNYFISRTASTSYDAPLVSNNDIGEQQIMIQNTGGLKMRLDTYDYLQGNSNNWVAAINVNSSLPNNLFPFKLPVKLFFDVGTYAEVWKKNNVASKFLYTGGLQITLLKEALNIYLPLFYSKVFKEALITDKEANKFLRKITFSIDVNKISILKHLRNL